MFMLPLCEGQKLLRLCINLSCVIQIMFGNTAVKDGSMWNGMPNFFPSFLCHIVSTRLTDSRLSTSAFSALDASRLEWKTVF